VANRLVGAGVEYDPQLRARRRDRSLPDIVSLRKVDLATVLQILSFYQQHRPVRDGGQGCDRPASRDGRHSPATRSTCC
jgi:hypothetical protein